MILLKEFEIRQAKMEERRLQYEAEQTARVQKMKEDSQRREAEIRKVIVLRIQSSALNLYDTFTLTGN